MELVCPAGNLPSLKAAVDAGADAVYIGFRNDTNARAFPSLNFDRETAAQGIRYAHRHARKVFVALNTYPQPRGMARWIEAAETALQLGADALILADIGLMRLLRDRYPDARLHLSVQGSATNRQALKFYREHFDIQRAVLPRVLSMSQIRSLAAHTSTPLEVFGFGGLCIMAEGRCHLSSYLTGDSPNKTGVCSPAWAVRWTETTQGLESRLNGVLIDRFTAAEAAGYPTLCKGRFALDGNILHALEEPTSLNTLHLLPDLHQAGVVAIKIEGRQRSLSYVRRVTEVWRNALDCLLADPNAFRVREAWDAQLADLSEGHQTTLGAYERPWQ